MRKLVPFILVLIFVSSCVREKFEETDTGVIVNLNSGNVTKLVRLDVVSSDIIQVRATTKNSFSDKKSLVAIDEPVESVSFKVEELQGSIVLSTPTTKAIVNSKTGEVSFENSEGLVKLVEKNGGGKTYTPNQRVEDLLQVRQQFESSDDEALYGLGQHQNNQMNYKGQDVDLSQYNLVAVVPFLVSNKNYGLLWDNYSRTKFGDIREYEPLSNLKLYDSEGNEGGLTANYYNSKNLNQPVLSRAEKIIQYENLEELKMVPSEFLLEGGMVKWNGEIESEFTGKHKLMLFSSGYLKLWVDGELLVDSWRQGWNPWTRRLAVDMTAGEKKSIRVEWKPDSGEAFVSLNWLSPIDKAEQNRISLYSEGANEINYYFINGNSADEVIKGYRQLTGKSPIMPKWSMGFWQSRERYKTREQMVNVVKEYRKRKIPLDNIVIDWHYWEEDKWGNHEFDLERFPDPAEMIEELHNDLNTHVMISVWPKYYKGTKNYKIMDEKGFLYKRNIEMKRKDWVGPGYESTFYDTFNEEARTEFWRQINNELFTKGIDAWWMDATEPDIHSNVSWNEKKKLMNPTALGSSEEYFNAFSLMQAKGVYEGQRKTNPNQRVFILTRSAFAGQQRYAAATWSGDVVSRWFDFKVQIPAGLNISVSGIPYWTMDIGGFSVEKRYENQDPAHLNEWRELNTRWFQYGAFCPLFRSHGQLPYREIFNIAPENSDYYKSMVYFNKLRYRLMPYIYSLAGATYFDDYTMMRPLMMDFADSKVLNITDEYMFGSAFLVAPVTDYKAREREVYLPGGNSWYNFFTGEYLAGGQSLIVDAPIAQMPLFVKAGSVVPVGSDIQYASEKTNEPVALHVYTGADGQFKLYEDEGTNYNYENGKFSSIIITYNDRDKQLTIGDCTGSFDGMTESREFRIIWHTPDTASGKELSETVSYSGNMIQVDY